ncbi:HAD family hydrolase [Candidatus Dormiibacter inghamiae]|uniref:HAD family hydrolase n=1 Tax=Candidatus Dormiibacter inghamiae TaxID=3127013 RepID=UPI0030C71136
MDLDGTVISADLQLDQRDVDAIGSAQAAGMIVVACTGRPFPGAEPWLRRLDLRGPCACYQGAQVRSASGEMLFDQGVPRALGLEVIQFCRERDLHVQAYRDDRLLVERDRPEAHQYANHAGMAINVVGDLGEAMDATTPKLVLVASPQRCEELLPEVRRRWAGGLEIATSLPNFMEFTLAGADKARALEFVCRHFGISQSESVAVGDGRNDCSMLEWAALSYAVQGAPVEVLEAAGGRTIGPPGTGGIASLIQGLMA